MSEAPARRLLAREDAGPLLALVGLALGLELATAWLGVRGGPLAPLAVYFDGHKYIEIAKSFPLPYAAEGRALLGHAPGYPAVLYLARLLTPDVVDWGALALGVAWLAGALAAAAFYLLCRETGTPPFWPAALFVAANPRWIGLGATAHPEPLAVLFAIACFVACLRGRLGWAVVWLTLASLTRYPALLLGIPLAWAALGRGVTVRRVLLLAVPLVAFALFNLYLFVHIPGFGGILEAHRFWWVVPWTWPFQALVARAGAFPGPPGLPLAAVTYASALFYLLALAAGFRRAERPLRFLPLWVACVLLFHACAGGPVGASAFTRLVVLAWPPALLLLWRAAAPRGRPALAAVLCAALGAFGVWFSERQIRLVQLGQARQQPFLADTIRRLDADEPVWVDFEAERRRSRGR